MTQSGECRILPAQSGIHLLSPYWHYFPIETGGGPPVALLIVVPTLSQPHCLWAERRESVAPRLLVSCLVLRVFSAGMICS